MVDKIKKLLLPLAPAIASGVFVITSSPGANIDILSPWLHWIALVPLFLAILRQNKFSSAYRLSFVTSFIIFGYSWSWFFSTVPLSWTGINGYWNSVAIVFFFWFIVVLFLAAVFSLWTYFFVNLKNIIYPPVLLAMAWTSFGLLSSIAFSIYSSGTGSRIGEFFSFGNLGYHLHSTPYVVHLAGLGGIYLLTFVLVLVNAQLANMVSRSKQSGKSSKNSFLVLAGIVVLVFGLGVLARISTQGETKKAINYMLVQTNNPSSESVNFEYIKRNNQELYGNIKQSLAHNKPDLIILPEYTYFLNNIENVPKSVVNKYLQELLGNPDTTLILNNRSESTNKSLPKNVTFSITPKEGVIDGYAKGFLTPLGESIPSLVNPFLGIFMSDSSLKNYREYRQYQSGNTLEPLETPHGLVAALPCSEIFSTSTVRKTVKNGGEIIAIPANLTIFNQSPMLLAYSEASAKIRAVETNRYVLVAANTGYSYVINNNGQLVNRTKQATSENLFGTAPMLSKKSIYTSTGNWIVWLSIFLLIGLTLRKNYSKSNKSSMK